MAEEQFAAQQPLAALLDRDEQFAQWAANARPTLVVAPWTGPDPPPAELTSLLDLADRHDLRLIELVEQRGWPGRSWVGEDGADAAWVIAQHADRHHEARRSWVPLVEEAAGRREADPRHFARLCDRVALIDGRPQQFGTYAALQPNGEVLFDPPADGDLADVDTRRATLGLPPLLEDLRDAADAAPYRWMRVSPNYQWPAPVGGR